MYVSMVPRRWQRRLTGVINTSEALGVFIFEAVGVLPVFVMLTGVTDTEEALKNWNNTVNFGGKKIK